MYNDIIKKLGSLSYKELKELHKAIEVELSYRESREPVAYKCPDCNFKGSFGEVYNHLIEEHNYDTGITTIYTPQEVYV
jgi:hypothetical protein